MFGMTMGEKFRFIFFDWWLYLINCLVNAVEHPHLIFIFILKVIAIIVIYYLVKAFLKWLYKSTKAWIRDE